MDEGGLAGAGDAGDGDEQTEGDFDVEAAEVVSLSAAENKLFPARRAAARGYGDGDFAGEVTAGKRVGVGFDFCQGAGGEELAAELASAGAEVEEIVGGAEDVGIMLDDDDGVAEVAEIFEDADEANGVAGVEADGWLVEDIERADELRAEGCGELDALGLTAGKRGGETVEGEVLQADGEEEAEALADFMENLAGDLLLRGR